MASLRVHWMDRWIWTSRDRCFPIHHWRDGQFGGDLESAANVSSAKSLCSPLIHVPRLIAMMGLMMVLWAIVPSERPKLM